MQFAKLKWENQQPYSLDFDDIYYSSEDGLAETEFVFIQHNQLDERFTSLSNTEFTIIETVFGTGLNFLCAAQHFLNHAPPNASLRFISIERYPLTPEDLAKANQHWPTLHEIAQALHEAYQQLTDGQNTFNLCKDRIKLELWIGDVNACLPQINASADAWFLDGFAPSQNSDMWS